MEEAQPVPVSDGVAIEFNAGGSGQNFATIDGKRIPLTTAETHFLVAGGEINKPRIDRDHTLNDPVIELMNLLYVTDEHMRGSLKIVEGPYNRDYLLVIRSGLKKKLNGGG